jgi:hypothetical protein
MENDAVDIEMAGDGAPHCVMLYGEDSRSWCVVSQDPCQ